jgi:hypothetical protein
VLFDDDDNFIVYFKSVLIKIGTSRKPRGFSIRTRVPRYFVVGITSCFNTAPQFSEILPPSSSPPTTGSHSTLPAPPWHTLSAVSSATPSYRSQCLSPFAPGSPPKAHRLYAPTHVLASTDPSWRNHSYKIKNKTTSNGAIYSHTFHSDDE